MNSLFDVLPIVTMAYKYGQYGLIVEGTAMAYYGLNRHKSI